MIFYNLYLLVVIARDGYLSHLFALLIEPVLVKTNLFMLIQNNFQPAHSVGLPWARHRNTIQISLEGQWRPAYICLAGITINLIELDIFV